MTTRRRLGLLAGTLALAAAIALAVGPVMAQRAAGGTAPRFQVDPWWPKPLPNNWLMGQAAGVAVDRHDHVWVIQRPRTLTEDERGAVLSPPRSRCCAPAPPVLEFDADGNLVRSWGGAGAGYDWPLTEHGIFVDHLDHVWIAGNNANYDLRLYLAHIGFPLADEFAGGAAPGEQGSGHDQSS